MKFKVGDSFISLGEAAAELRAAGIKRCSFERIVLAGDDHFIMREIELFDTIPAPPFETEPLPEQEPPKAAGLCIAVGCAEKNGWQFDTRYCAPHGRAAAGVKP